MALLRDRWARGGLVGVCAAALAVVGWGCGFGGGGDVDRLSRAEYSERGRSLCGGVRAELERSEARETAPTEEIVAKLRGLLADLRRLDPPVELEAEAYRFEEALRRQLDVAGDPPSARDGGSAPPAGQLDELASMRWRSTERPGRVSGWRGPRACRAAVASDGLIAAGPRTIAPNRWPGPRPPTKCSPRSTSFRRVRSVGLAGMILLVTACVGVGCGSGEGSSRVSDQGDRVIRLDEDPERVGARRVERFALIDLPDSTRKLRAVKEQGFQDESVEARFVISRKDVGEFIRGARFLNPPEEGLRYVTGSEDPTWDVDDVQRFLGTSDTYKGVGRSVLIDLDRPGVAVVYINVRRQ